jgi:hypothetical protein
MSTYQPVHLCADTAGGKWEKEWPRITQTSRKLSSMFPRMGC